MVGVDSVNTYQVLHIIYEKSFEGSYPAETLPQWCTGIAPFGCLFWWLFIDMWIACSYIACWQHVDTFAC